MSRLVSKLNRNRLVFGAYLIVIATGMSIFYISEDAKVNVMPVYDKCIVIDSGHGGNDPGKVSGKANEKDINLSISKKLETYLEHGGSCVVMTREDDNALSDIKREDLKERKNIINSAGNDLFISIHQNSFPDSSVKGAQVFYHSDSEESKKLGECIQNRLRELDETNERVAKGNDSYYILKGAEIPAVIVECGFLSNADEKKKLMNEEYQEKIAWCIYKGIIDYYTV